MGTLECVFKDAQLLHDAVTSLPHPGTVIVYEYEIPGTSVCLGGQMYDNSPRKVADPFAMIEADASANSVDVVKKLVTDAVHKVAPKNTTAQTSAEACRNWDRHYVGQWMVETFKYTQLTEDEFQRTINTYGSHCFPRIGEVLAN